MPRRIINLCPGHRSSRFSSAKKLPSSLRFRFWCDYPLNQCLKSWIAMQRIKQWIGIDPANVGAVALFVTLFEPAQRFVFVVQAEIKQSAQIADDLAVLTYVIELTQHLPRRIFVTSVRFGLRPERRHSRVVA